MNLKELIAEKAKEYAQRLFDDSLLRNDNRGIHALGFEEYMREPEVLEILEAVAREAYDKGSWFEVRNQRDDYDSVGLADALSFDQWWKSVTEEK